MNLPQQLEADDTVTGQALGGQIIEQAVRTPALVSAGVNST